MLDHLLAFPAPVGCQAGALWRGDWDPSKPQSMDWEALLQTAEAGSALPMLYNAIQRNGYVHFIPQFALDRIETVYRRTQVVNTARREKLRQTLGLLNAVGIPVIVLKGAALSELVYGDIGLRPMIDLDLLVRSEHVGQAMAILKAAGYQRAGNPELRPGFDRLFKIETKLNTLEPFSEVVEIHWDLDHYLPAVMWITPPFGSEPHQQL